MTTAAGVPAVEGWFTTGERPRLLGRRCPACGTYSFPPLVSTCPNPACDGTAMEPAELSDRGTLWSYTVNHYPPPAPYVAADPFVPYAIAAVELAAERMVVMGQVVADADPSTLRVGAEMELVIDTLFVDDQGTPQLVWKWRPTGGAR